MVNEEFDRLIIEVKKNPLISGKYINFIIESNVRITVKIDLLKRLIDLNLKKPDNYKNKKRGNI